ncbi:shikimate kinase [Weeksellaceae bacterium TAE3-ERU29]|nr:shikimate kinase [Weeksellaceae bacterium TAE3-ERU29]
MVITLIGYMGSGKSSIGKILSEKLNYTFLDLDEVIEKQEKLKISEIFKKKGEVYFRKLESQTLKNILESQDNIILSTGGGTPVFYDNMDSILKKSVSFYLQATPITLAERLDPEKQSRPLIAHLPKTDLPEFIAKHLFERNPFYQKSKFTIKTDGLTPQEIADEIISLV